MSAHYDLTGHVALVTGANHGIGAATARALGAAGAGVLVSFLRSATPPGAGLPDAYGEQRAAGADAVVDAIRAAGGRALGVEADLADPATPAQLFDAAEAELGPVDILINNASGWLADSFRADESDRLGRRLERVSADTIERQFAVDARAGALLIAELARRHRERGTDWGRIVSLTSGGPLGFPEEVSYGAAKAALENYTMSAALELAELGITANTLLPPVTDTGWITDDVRDFVAASREHVHIASPDDVARVILFLVSDEARLLTANRVALR